MKLISLTLAALLSSFAAQAAPVQNATHAYGLNRSYADELGGSALAHTGGRLLAKRYRFETGQGLTLSAAVPTSHYSIEMQVALTDLGGYRRLIGFSTSSADNGLYVHDGSLEFYPATADTPVSFQVGKRADVVITRDAASRIVTLYVDGVQQASFEDDAGIAVFDTDANGRAWARLFIDDNGEDAAGALNYLRVFGNVLSPAEVRKLSKGKLPGNVTGE